MKNLRFEFSNYDKVFNLSSNIVLFLRKKSSFIEANLIVFREEEVSYKFSLDNSCILDTLKVNYFDNKIFFVWQNVESNIILSIFRIEGENIFNKNQIIVSYDYTKTSKSPLINYESNKLLVFWLESNCYNKDYSKFELKQNTYELDETLDDLYVNLIDSKTLVENIEISLVNKIYNTDLIIENDNYYFVYAYKNKFNKYKILFMDIDKKNSFYINSDEINIISLSMFNLRNKIYIFWINDTENIYGRVIEKRNNESILEKELISTLKNPFDFFYQNKDLYQSLDDDKLLKIPLKLTRGEIVELLIYSSGKNSFIIIFDSTNQVKMQIKFEINNLVSLDNKNIFNNSDIVTISLTTDISINHIIFFKYSIINDFLICYQNREIKSDYNISKIEEILLELNKGVNQINDELINYDKKSIAIFKLFNELK
tara:strand:- start:1660 stop:2943 length:1284 start_codon:yes stop_codon:yes gene_type:complete